MDEAVCASMAAVDHNDWWHHGRRAVVAAVIARLGLPANARILEAGCGPGGNLDMLSGSGSASAFEPHAPSRAVGASRGFARVVDGSLPGGSPFAGSFDLACAFDAVEPILHDVGARCALGNRLAPGAAFAGDRSRGAMDVERQR